MGKRIWCKFHPRFLHCMDCGECRSKSKERRSKSGNKRMARGLSPHDRGEVMGHEIRKGVRGVFENTAGGTGD